MDTAKEKEKAKKLKAKAKAKNLKKKDGGEKKPALKNECENITFNDDDHTYNLTVRGINKLDQYLSDDIKIGSAIIDASFTDNIKSKNRLSVKPPQNNIILEGNGANEEQIKCVIEGGNGRQYKLILTINKKKYESSEYISKITEMYLDIQKARDDFYSSMIDTIYDDVISQGKMPSNLNYTIQFKILGNEINAYKLTRYLPDNKIDYTFTFNPYCNGSEYKKVIHNGKKDVTVDFHLFNPGIIRAHHKELAAKTRVHVAQLSL